MWEFEEFMNDIAPLLRLLSELRVSTVYFGGPLNKYIDPEIPILVQRIKAALIANIL